VDLENKALIGGLSNGYLGVKIEIFLVFSNFLG